MIRYVFALLLIVVSGFFMFKVKFAVQELEDELGRVRRQTVAEQQEVRVLNAEWSYLTQPERLAELNRRFIALAPVPTKQYQRSLEEIALRPPPPPAPEPAYPPPDTVTASDEPPPPAVAPAMAAAAPPALPVSAPANLSIISSAAAAPVVPASASAPPVAPATIKRIPAAPAQLVKASTARSPRSLDELLARIEGGR
jgi:hypothetical protein